MSLFQFKKNLSRFKRGLFLILSSGLILVSFQNCNNKLGSNTSTATSSTTKNSSAASGTTSLASNSTMLGGGSSGSGSSNSTVLGGSGSSAGSTSSTVLGGSGSSAGGSTTILGGGSGSSSGGTTASSGGSTSSAYRFTTQPKSQELKADSDNSANLDFTFTGGEAPYKYQWYKNGSAISASSELGPLCSTGTYCIVTSDRYSHEGSYKVVVTDSRGNTITSDTANVSIVDPAVGCTAGSFAMFSGSGYLNSTTNSYLSQLFLNSRGVFLVSTGNKNINPYMSSPGIMGFTIVSGMPTASYSQNIARADLCAQSIPNVNTPKASPGGGYAGIMGNNCSSSIIGGNTCGTYQRTGSVNFQCINNKWKLISNTCGWVFVKSTNSFGF